MLSGLLSSGSRRSPITRASWVYSTRLKNMGRRDNAIFCPCVSLYGTPESYLVGVQTRRRRRKKPQHGARHRVFLTKGRRQTERLRTCSARCSPALVVAGLVKGAQGKCSLARTKTLFCRNVNLQGTSVSTFVLFLSGQNNIESLEAGIRTSRFPTPILRGTSTTCRCHILAMTIMAARPS